MYQIFLLGTFADYKMFKPEKRVSYYTAINTVMFQNLTRDKKKTLYVSLINVIKLGTSGHCKCFKRTHCDIYSTKNITVMFCYLTIE